MMFRASENVHILTLTPLNTQTHINELTLRLRITLVRVSKKANKT